MRCETDVCIQRSRAKIQKALQKLGASGIRCGFGVSKRGIQLEILKVPRSYSFLLVKKYLPASRAIILRLYNKRAIILLEISKCDMS